MRRLRLERYIDESFFREAQLITYVMMMRRNAEITPKNGEECRKKGEEEKTKG